MVKFQCAFAQTGAPDRVDRVLAQAVSLTYEAAPIRYGSGNPTNQMGAHVARRWSSPRKCLRTGCESAIIVWTLESVAMKG